jgi:nitroreductase
MKRLKSSCSRRFRKETPRGDWVMFDMGIATEHLALAAAAEGLGTVHVGLFDYQKAGDILELPKDRTVIELIPLGYPAYIPRLVPRKPLEEFIFKNKYGRKLTG